jgi:HD-GYP domain-containing protein (c-di-GMP phosphodiesterase class II)
MGHPPHLSVTADGGSVDPVTAHPAEPAPTRPRRAELVAALSLGLDLGLGQPMDHMLRAAVIATRLADRVGLDADRRGIVFYAQLLSWIGCQADSPELTALFVDEIAFRAGTFPVDLQGLDRARYLLGQARHGRPPAAAGLAVARMLATGPRAMQQLIASHYASAGALADRLGMGVRVRDAIHHTFERWDGTGLPRGVGGEAIPIEMRVVHVADVTEVHLREHGPVAAVEMARRRRGTHFDPLVVDALCFAPRDVLDGLDGADGVDAWPVALGQAPDPDRPLSDAELDDLMMAMGDFIDLKSPFRQGHSRRVADLAGAAGRLVGLTGGQQRDLRRAGWVHDLGRLGVPNSIWNKAGRLSSTERERVRLYPYFTQRMFGRVPSLAGVAALAGSHRERLDGSGFPKGVDAAFLTMPARLLAVADRLAALTEPRSDRVAIALTDAVRVLDRDAAAGLLDADAVAAVASAAGDRPHRRARTAGLTAREAEVLALAAVGRTTRQIAGELVISEKTARNHLEHIYTKTGVANRAGASLFAVQHGIVRPGQP